MSQPIGDAPQPPEDARQSLDEFAFQRSLRVMLRHELAAHFFEENRILAANYERLRGSSRASRSFGSSEACPLGFLDRCFFWRSCG
jgi:hypothetical protein